MATRSNVVVEIRTYIHIRGYRSSRGDWRRPLRWIYHLVCCSNNKLQVFEVNIPKTRQYQASPRFYYVRSATLSNLICQLKNPCDIWLSPTLNTRARHSTTEPFEHCKARPVIRGSVIQTALVGFQQNFIRATWHLAVDNVIRYIQEL